MIVVVKHPGQPAYQQAVDGRRADSLDNLIGGYPGRCMRWSTNHGELVAWCDDDGIAKGLPINFARPTDAAEIRGPVVVTTWAPNECAHRDWSGLSGPQAAEAMDMLAALGVE